MLFNSAVFIFAFLPVVVALSWLVVWLPRGIVWRRAILVTASLFFYGYWNIWFLPLLVVSILLNYGASILIERWREPHPHLGKILVVLSVAGNLLSIGYFKYLLFFAEFAIETDQIPDFVRNIVLPIGISFFTFQQIAYVVDVWKKQVDIGDFLSYALFVSFFPQLIAGPVVRYQQIVPQFTRIGDLTRCFAPGLFLFVVGLFKKVVLADSFADPANAVFDAAARGSVIGFVDGWVAALSYTFQLYFDFSAYSDMALGLGLMLGFTLPVNFNSPYKATNLIEFWRRWHITLSAFFRDYLYIPLGGNRHGLSRQLIVLFLVMVLVGFWHGAGWTFLLWGAWHGCLLAFLHGVKALPASAASRLAELSEHVPSMLRLVMAWSLTFSLVVVGWVLFRAANFDAAMAMVSGMVDPFAVTKHLLYDARYYAALGLILAGFLICLYLPNAVQIAAVFGAADSLFHQRGQALEPAEVPLWLNPNAGSKAAGLSYRLIILLGAMFYLSVTTMMASTSEFLYFQF